MTSPFFSKKINFHQRLSNSLEIGSDPGLSSRLPDG